MRYTALSTFEARFLQTGNNGEYKLHRISIPVPRESLKLEGWLCTPQARSGYYYNVAHPKERIVVHYTAGSLRSDLEALTTNNRHVSVPFVIARDGSIYQLFSSKFWSGNLGKGVGNTNTGNAQDKCTIAIELSNYGWLTERSGTLETCYSRLPMSNGVPGSADVYCTLDETEAYQQLNTQFRGQSYYATFTKAQYQSLVVLLRYLTATYNIPRQFLPEPMRYQTTNEVLNFKGIVSHVNYRIDGKWDIGPAFDWNTVIQGVQAAEYHPAVSRSVVVRDSAAPITSEDQLDDLLPAPEDASHEDEPYNETPESTADQPDMDSEKGSAKPRRQKLYALLVGVDDYKEDIVLNQAVVFPKLSGCVPDAKRIKSYLENDPAFDADIQLITNEQATKSEIARLFKEHLGRAEEGDTALFFFSGHGTQEWADIKLWKEDTDGKLECIVCYYENATDNKLLADKELRYLLHELSQTGAHCVALFDCCHSGDNTRALVQETFPDIKVKAIPYVFPKRPYDDFIFNQAINLNNLQQQGEGQLLPEGAHVQFSACESDESALEVSGSGVFTQTLLRVLKNAGGDVSYQSLGSRIRQYLKNVYEQKPRVYAVGEAGDLSHTNFLNRPSTGPKRSLGELVYNDEKGWKFTLGAIHGITEQTKNITITDPDTNESYEGTITAFEIDSSYVSTDAKLRQNKTYNGAVTALFSRMIKVSFQKTEDALKEMRQLLDVVLEDAKYYITLEEDEQAADYVVRLQQEKFYITKPGDPYRPLTAPQSSTVKNAAQTIAAQLVHIAQWNFLQHLENTDSNTRLPDDVLKPELTVGKDQTPVLDALNTAVIQYNNVNGRWENIMTVKLTNTSGVNLYCSVLYLSSAFGADTDFLNPPVYMLEPGNTVPLAYEKETALPLELNDIVKFYNWNEEVEYLKCIISTEPFDVQALALEPLPKPSVPGIKEPEREQAGGATRGIRKRTLGGWATQTITLRLQNPVYNKLDDAAKQAVLADEATHDFAVGLYPHVSAVPKAKPLSPPAAPAPSILDDRGNAVNKTDNTPTPTRAAPPSVYRDGAPKSNSPSVLGRIKRMFKKENPVDDFETGSGSVLSSMDKALKEADITPKNAPAGRTTGSTMAKPPAMAPAAAPIATPEPPPASPVTRSREGQLEYDIPGQMQTNKSYVCRVAIAGADVNAALMKLSESSVHEAIRIAEEMSVQLIDCSGGACFTIVPLSTERQSIDEGEQTRWSFEVTPKQSGNHCLVLKITMHANGKNKDLDILEKEVLVQADGTNIPMTTGNAITRILFLAANPSDTTMLRVGAETRQIKEEIAQAHDRDRFLFTTNFAVTTRTLSRSILQEDPTIVHFSGHGDEEGLCLETESGLTKQVDAAALDALFKNFANTIQCVILNACYSKTQATAIAQHIPFVIGMSSKVADEAALAFSVGFYQALVDGWDIEKAFNLGTAAMALSASGSSDVAVLFKKPMVQEP